MVNPDKGRMSPPALRQPPNWAIDSYIVVVCLLHESAASLDIDWKELEEGDCRERLEISRVASDCLKSWNFWHFVQELLILRSLLVDVDVYLEILHNNSTRVNYINIRAEHLCPWSSEKNKLRLLILAAGGSAHLHAMHFKTRRPGERQI